MKTPFSSLALFIVFFSPMALTSFADPADVDTVKYTPIPFADDGCRATISFKREDGTLYKKSGSCKEMIKYMKTIEKGSEMIISDQKKSRRKVVSAERSGKKGSYINYRLSGNAKEVDQFREKIDQLFDKE